MKKYKAYILSRENGVVQIGNTVYCLFTDERFEADKPSYEEALAIYEVPTKSFAGAWQAFHMDSLWYQGKLPMSKNLKR